MEILTLIIIGLFGSGGIVAFYTIWSSNKTRRKEIDLDIKKVEMANTEPRNLKPHSMYRKIWISHI